MATDTTSDRFFRKNGTKPSALYYYQFAKKQTFARRNGWSDRIESILDCAFSSLSFSSSLSPPSFQLPATNHRDIIR